MVKYQKWFILLCFYCLLLISGQQALAAEKTNIAGENDSFVLSQISAEAVCLMVADTGKVLYEKNKDKIMYPASTTKIVTALIALQNGKLDDVVTVSSKAANVEGSSLDLVTGDKIVLKELLYGLMLVSGNDAAVAVAEHIGQGSVWRFVKKMNDFAEKVGAKKTHFSNPNGLPDPQNHFTTAYDMALMTTQAMKRMDFIDIVSKRSYNIKFINKESRWIKNTNKFLGSYKGANGVKTGYTEAAGDCLVASAKINGVQLICVIFNDDERWEDAVKIMDYGFKKVSKLTYVK